MFYFSRPILFNQAILLYACCLPNPRRYQCQSTHILGPLIIGKVEKVRPVDRVVLQVWGRGPWALCSARDTIASKRQMIP